MNPTTTKKAIPADRAQPAHWAAALVREARQQRDASEAGTQAEAEATARLRAQLEAKLPDFMTTLAAAVLTVMETFNAAGGATVRVFAAEGLALYVRADRGGWIDARPVVPENPPRFRVTRYVPGRGRPMEERFFETTENGLIHIEGLETFEAVAKWILEPFLRAIA